MHIKLSLNKNLEYNLNSFKTLGYLIILLIQTNSIEFNYKKTIIEIVKYYLIFLNFNIRTIYFFYKK